MQAAKLHTDPARCALALMSSLFSEELANGNLNGTTNSKDPDRQKNIQQLDPIRIQYIQSMQCTVIIATSVFVIYKTDFIESKWPGSYQTLTKKMTQKCTDAYKNYKKIKQ